MLQTSPVKQFDFVGRQLLITHVHSSRYDTDTFEVSIQGEVVNRTTNLPLALECFDELIERYAPGNIVK
jgi:hypothetical protein